MQLKSNGNITKHVALMLFGLAFLERIVFDLGPNAEIITAAIVLTSTILSPGTTALFGLIVIALSDLLLGNSSIFIFTWSAFLLIGLFSSKLNKTLAGYLRNKSVSHISTGITSNLFFFFWTNFGVWLLDSWGMYEKTPKGLVRCFVNGLPFLKNQIITTAIAIPILLMLINSVNFFARTIRYYSTGKFRQARS